MFNIPDIRIPFDYLGIPWLSPRYVRKSYILNPEEYEKQRDWLINLYFAKPDYEAPQEKFYYSTLLGSKIGIVFNLFIRNETKF